MFALTLLILSQVVTPGLADESLPLLELPVFRPCCGFGYNFKFLGIPAPFSNLIGTEKFVSEHTYGVGLKSVALEPNGILFSRRGGFIDTAHVRDHADWTVFLARWLDRNWGKTSSLTLPPQSSKRALMTIQTRGRKPSPETFIRIAQRASYEFTYWHEVATWCGYNRMPMFSEQSSAFSPEDLYSNVLGTYVGAEVAFDVDIDSAMVSALRRAMERLEGVEEEESRQALDTAAAWRWWDPVMSAGKSERVRKRHFGDFDRVEPWLPPTLGSAPETLELPHLSAEGEDLWSYYTLSIEPEDHVRKCLGIESFSVGSRDLRFIGEEVRRQADVQLGAGASRP